MKLEPNTDGLVIISEKPGSCGLAVDWLLSPSNKHVNKWPDDGQADFWRYM